jgi:hypothetical protein
MSVRLVCPLCGAVAYDGPEPSPGRCPGCGARFEGGAESAAGAVAAALTALGADGLDADALATALFELDPDGDLARLAAVTSDRRQGFYRWWVFVREGDEPARAILARVAAGAG